MTGDVIIYPGQSDLVEDDRSAHSRPLCRTLPDIVLDGGNAARTAWDDFFEGTIRNDHTRIAYQRAVRYFLAWANDRGRHALHEITAGDIGRYLRAMSGGLAKKKQHLAALRRFFNLMVERHLCVINPAAVAQTERLTVIEGRTPSITAEQAKQLYAAIDTETLIGLRDRAIIATLNFTGARGGAVGKLQLKDYYDAGNQWMLHFDEKGGKSREIPVSHDLKDFLDAYIKAAKLCDESRRRDPATDAKVKQYLFPTTVRRKRQNSENQAPSHKIGRKPMLSNNPMTSHEIGRMLKRRLRQAGLPTRLTPHSFRVAVASDLDDQQVRLEDIQHLLGYVEIHITQLMESQRICGVFPRSRKCW